MSVIPHRFLFRFSLPVRKVARMPKKGQQLLNLPETCILPHLGDLDDEQRIGEVRAAWNPHGMGFSIKITGKQHELRCDAKAPSESDGLQIWIDTRNTQTIHRASRFCHRFCVLPSGAGPHRDQPIAIPLPIPRAKDAVSLADSAEIPVKVNHSTDGYLLEVWLPAAVLTGFDPEASPSLGFYYHVRDSELGEQFLTVGNEFPFSHDPSLWSTLELTP